MARMDRRMKMLGTPWRYPGSFLPGAPVRRGNDVWPLGRRARGVTRRITATGLPGRSSAAGSAAVGWENPGRSGELCQRSPILSCIRYDVRSSMPDRVRLRTHQAAGRRTGAPRYDGAGGDADGFRRDDDHVVRARLCRGPHAGRQGRAVRSRGSQIRAARARPAVEAMRRDARHARPRGSQRQRAADRQPDPTDLARDPRAAALAEQRLLGADDVIGMNKGGTVEARGLGVTMTSADHSAGDWDNESGTPRYLGEPAGFVVELEDGGRLYHAGDTNVFGDMRLIGELYHPDVALPIGGHYTMGPREGGWRSSSSACARCSRSTTAPSRSCAGRRTAPLELAARGLGDVIVHALEPGDRSLAEDGRRGTSRPVCTVPVREGRSGRCLYALSGRNARCSHASEVACTPISRADPARDPILDGRDSLRLVKLRLGLTLIAVAILPIAAVFAARPSGCGRGPRQPSPAPRGPGPDHGPRAPARGRGRPRRGRGAPVRRGDPRRRHERRAGCRSQGRRRQAQGAHLATGRGRARRVARHGRRRTGDLRDGYRPRRVAAKRRRRRPRDGHPEGRDPGLVVESAHRRG